MKFSSRKISRIIALPLLAFLLIGCVGIPQTQISSTPQTDALKTNIPIPTHTVLSIPEPTQSHTADQSIWQQRENWPGANQIRSLIIDSSGALWAGGPAGLTRWDPGLALATTYAVSSQPEKSNVVALTQVPNGDVWVGTYGNGITRIPIHGQWITFTINNGLPSNYFTSLVSADDGTLWGDTSPFARDRQPLDGGHFGRFDGKRWIAGTGGGFYQIVSSPDGDIWGLTLIQFGQTWESSISRWDGNTWEYMATGNEPFTATAIAAAPDGAIWMAATDGILFFKNNTWHKIHPPWNSETAVAAIEVASDETVWFGLSNGAGIFGPCGDRLGDNEEWGVYQYDRKNWINYTMEDGLIDNKVCSITSGLDGSIWFGSYDQGISRFDGKEWTSYIVR